AGPGGFGAVAVAAPGQHAGERRHAGPARGDALVVFESGQPRQLERGVHLAQDLPHAAALPPAAADVEYLQPGDRLALLTSELGAANPAARPHPPRHPPPLAP